MPQILLSEGPDQGVRLLTLNCSETLNALDTPLPKGLEAFHNKLKPEFSGHWAQASLLSQGFPHG